ncbi:MAG: TetR/AcrR family transcriptional regulator [Deltaproteobacteria bacterium]|nr:TetR/AcrR family transcriptional regulator [Deltaproteobacteria bacterium]
MKPTHDNPPKPVLSKGMQTRASILEAAQNVFKTSGYYGSSVSEITRQADLSMGTFYQYFKNKEQLFIELTDQVVADFLEKAQATARSGTGFDARLKNIVNLCLLHTKENFDFHRILGESELTDRVTIGYYESIVRYFRDFFREEIRAGNVKPLDPNMVAYGLVGTCDFITMDWGEPETDFDSGQAVTLIADILKKGIGGTAPWRRHPGWEQMTLPDPTPLNTVEKHPLTKGQKTRHALLRAAEKVFGTHGVNHANISEITRQAGVAQGTFYVHFKSKADLVEGFVKYINRHLRREIQRTVGTHLDRRDAEWMGMLAFFRFLTRHRSIYRVVPEFEIIGHELGLWYYKKLAEGYAAGLEKGIARREIRRFPAVFLSRYLMGVSHFIGLKWIVWGSAVNPELPPSLFKDIRELILFGLAK